MTASASTWRSDVRAVTRDPALFIWCMFLLAGPFDVFRQGLPQPGDWLVLLLTPFALLGWNGRLDKRNGTTVKALFLFTLWVFIVNWGWATILWKWGRLFDYVIHPFFYVFNAAVFLSAILVSRRDPQRFLRITVALVFTTIAACALSSTFSARGGGRTHVFFNSPNQMGYYALLAACLFAMTQKTLGLSRLKTSVGVTLCAYIALLSASRASLAGIMLLLLVLVISNPKVIIVAVIAGTGLVTLLSGPIDSAVEFNSKRAVENRDPKVTFAEERGYDRIWNFPQYLLFGAGEGDNARFAVGGAHPRELHSSFGSLLFSYGLLGTSLFLRFCFYAVRGATLGSTALLVPALVYTVAHQGLRFTMFWVVLVCFVVLQSAIPRANDRVRAKA